MSVSANLLKGISCLCTPVMSCGPSTRACSSSSGSNASTQHALCVSYCLLVCISIAPTTCSSSSALCSAAAAHCKNCSAVTSARLQRKSAAATAYQCCLPTVAALLYCCQLTGAQILSVHCCCTSSSSLYSAQPHALSERTAVVSPAPTANHITASHHSSSVYLCALLPRLDQAHSRTAAQLRIEAFSSHHSDELLQSTYKQVLHPLYTYLVLVSHIDDSAELASLWAVVDQAHTADLYEASETLHTSNRMCRNTTNAWSQSISKVTQLCCKNRKLTAFQHKNSPIKAAYRLPAMVVCWVALQQSTPVLSVQLSTGSAKAR
jgi:hypothetical protein